MFQVVQRKSIESCRERLWKISKILRKQAESLNFTGIEFPVSSKAIDKFERLNPKIAVSVLGYENSIYQ